MLWLPAESVVLVLKAWAPSVSSPVEKDHFPEASVTAVPMGTPLSKMVTSENGSPAPERTRLEALVIPSPGIPVSSVKPSVAGSSGEVRSTTITSGSEGRLTLPAESVDVEVKEWVPSANSPVSNFHEPVESTTTSPIKTPLS